MPQQHEMDNISAEEYAKRISAAAVSFANDHGGPLAASGGGVHGDIARARMGQKLLEVLRANGLMAKPI